MLLSDSSDALPNASEAFLMAAFVSFCDESGSRAMSVTRYIGLSNILATSCRFVIAIRKEKLAILRKPEHVRVGPLAEYEQYLSARELPVAVHHRHGG
jgi:hypothetical protein